MRIVKVAPEAVLTPWVREHDLWRLVTVLAGEGGTTRTDYRSTAGLRMMVAQVTHFDVLRELSGPSSVGTR